jgi:hypothetical protein
LVGIYGGELRLDNEIDPRFPTLIAEQVDGLVKNHHETKLISAERKKEIVESNRPKITEMTITHQARQPKTKVKKKKGFVQPPAL